jgi:hypothetical protein
VVAWLGRAEARERKNGRGINPSVIFLVGGYMSTLDMKMVARLEKRINRLREECRDSQNYLFAILPQDSDIRGLRILTALCQAKNTYEKLNEDLRKLSLEFGETDVKEGAL